MKRKISKKNKNTTKKEGRGKKFSEKEKYRYAAPVFMAILTGIALGMFISILYFQQQVKSSPPQNSLPEKQAETDAETQADQPVNIPLVPPNNASSAIYTFSATVSKVEGSKIFVDYFSCSKGNKTYVVSVSKDTIFLKSRNNQDNLAEISDVKVGDNVAVYAFENINKKSNLTARKIMIMGEINVSSPSAESLKE